LQTAVAGRDRKNVNVGIRGNKEDAARNGVVLSCCLAVAVEGCVVVGSVVVVCVGVERKKVVTSVSNVVKNAKKIDCSV
jgi:hypothetical protein